IAGQFPEVDDAPAGEAAVGDDPPGHQDVESRRALDGIRLGGRRRKSDEHAARQGADTHQTPTSRRPARTSCPCGPTQRSPPVAAPAAAPSTQTEFAGQRSKRRAIPFWHTTNRTSDERALPAKVNETLTPSSLVRSSGAGKQMFHFGIVRVF